MMKSFVTRITQRVHYNQFDSIAKGGIEQATEGRAELVGDCVRGKGQDGRKRDDGEEVDGKDGGRAPIASASEDANGDCEQEKVDIIWVRLVYKS